MPRIGIVVLAAGRSTRFADDGAHKLLALLGNAPVVWHSVRAAIDSQVGDVVVVTGAEAVALNRVLHGLPIRVVNEPAFADGMATSLRCGVEAFRNAVDAVMIALGDQPGMRPESYRRVAATWQETGAAIVVPRYTGFAAPSHPALFDAALIDELTTLSGDVGARWVIMKQPDRVAEATLDWPPPRDIDTIADLSLLAAELAELADPTRASAAPVVPASTAAPNKGQSS